MFGCACSYSASNNKKIIAIESCLDVCALMLITNSTFSAVTLQAKQSHQVLPGALIMRWQQVNCWMNLV